jgi:hypothetical protein
MAYEPKPDELGALWVRTGAKGEYMTGTINGVDVVCFRNKSDNPKAPQWKVLKSKPRDAMATPPATQHNANAKELTDEDIPF